MALPLFERGLRIDGWLKDARHEVGMTQAELAAAIGCKQPHVSAIETGLRGVSPERLQRIEDALAARRKATVAS